MIPIETLSGMGVGIKENGEKENSSMVYVTHLKNFYKSTMYPHTAQQ
jgi:hypothetical protein